MRSTIDMDVGMITRGLNPFVEVKKINQNGITETMNVEESGWTPSLLNSKFQITQLAFPRLIDNVDTEKKKRPPIIVQKEVTKYET